MSFEPEEYRFTRMKRELARRHQENGDNVAAEYELREALSRYPNNAYVIHDLADLLFRLKKRPEAKELLALLLSQNPRHTGALFLMGKILHHEKDFQKALEFLKNSLLAENLDKTKLALANLYIDMDRENDALPYVKTVLESKPDNLPFLKALARIYKKKGELELALREYEKIIRRDPDDAFAYSEYISLKTSSRPEDEAIRQIDLVMKAPSRQKNVHLMIKRGFHLKKLQQYGEAARQFQEALAIEPDNDYIRQQLGYIFNTLKKYEDAQALLTQSLFLNPNDIRLRKTLVAAANKIGTKEAMERLLSALKDLLVKNPHMKILWGDINKTQKKLESLNEKE